MFDELDQYLGKLKVPYLGQLRQSTNYLRALPARHGHLRAARIPGAARLGAVEADHEVARQQEEPAELKRRSGILPRRCASWQRRDFCHRSPPAAAGHPCTRLARLARMPASTSAYFSSHAQVLQHPFVADAARFVEERQALRAEGELRFFHRHSRRRRQAGELRHQVDERGRAERVAVGDVVDAARFLVLDRRHAGLDQVVDVNAVADAGIFGRAPPARRSAGVPAAGGPGRRFPGTRSTTRRTRRSLHQTRVISSALTRRRARSVRGCTGVLSSTKPPSVSP